MGFKITRRIGGKIIINGNITITVIKIKEKNIVLDFTFPPETSILRSEIIDRARPLNQEDSNDKLKR